MPMTERADTARRQTRRRANVDRIRLERGHVFMVELSVFRHRS
jgi:hypothetical protein